jgi:hypothetical protein
MSQSTIDLAKDGQGYYPGFHGYAGKSVLTPLNRTLSITSIPLFNDIQWPGGNGSYCGVSSRFCPDGTEFTGIATGCCAPLSLLNYHNNRLERRWPNVENNTLTVVNGRDESKLYQFMCPGGLDGNEGEWCDSCSSGCNNMILHKWDCSGDVGIGRNGYRSACGVLNKEGTCPTFRSISSTLPPLSSSTFTPVSDSARAGEMNCEYRITDLDQCRAILRSISDDTETGPVTGPVMAVPEYFAYALVNRGLAVWITDTFAEGLYDSSSDSRFRRSFELLNYTISQRKQSFINGISTAAEVVQVRNDYNAYDFDKTINTIKEALLWPTFSIDENGMWMLTFMVYSRDREELEREPPRVVNRLINNFFRDTSGNLSSTNSGSLPISEMTLRYIGSNNTTINFGVYSDYSDPFYQDQYIIGATVRCEVTRWSILSFYMASLQLGEQITYDSALIDKIQRDTRLYLYRAYSDQCLKAGNDDVSPECATFLNQCDINYTSPVSTIYLENMYLISSSSPPCNCWNSNLQPVINTHPGNRNAMCFDERCSDSRGIPTNISDNICNSECSEFRHNLNNNWVPRSSPHINHSRLARLCGVSSADKEKINWAILTVSILTSLIVGISLYHFSPLQWYLSISIAVFVLVVGVLLAILLIGTYECDQNKLKSVCKSNNVNINIPSVFCKAVNINCNCVVNGDCDEGETCTNGLCVKYEDKGVTQAYSKN